MSTPIQDAYDENATTGIKKVMVDGEMVEMHDLDQQAAAADREAKRQAAASSAGRAGLKMFRVKTGGAAPL